MEDKIREVLTSEIGLSGCGESEITGLNKTIEKLLMVFEQEKQAYARDMCLKVYGSFGHQVFRSGFKKWINHTFPDHA